MNNDRNDTLLDDAEIYAQDGNTAEMERMLLGVLASGTASDYHHERMEKIQSIGYSITIPAYKTRIQSMDHDQRKKRMHLEVYGLLHAASMASLESFEDAVRFVYELNYDAARQAILDFYPSIDDERLSMLEHDKIRNARNHDYFRNIQTIMKSVVPELHE